MSTWDNKAINGKDLQENVVQPLAAEIRRRGVHWLKLVGDDVIEETSPYGWWVLDLAKPNAEAKGGFERLTADEAVACADRGEVFAIMQYDDVVDGHSSFRTIGWQCKFENNGGSNPRIDFLRHWYSEPNRIEGISIYTPTSHGYVVLLGHTASSTWWEIELVDKNDLASVATSGDYSDLNGKPTIPTVDQVYDSTSANAQSGSAVASAISGKQDSIADLNNIRSGSEAGSTAVQPEDLATKEEVLAETLNDLDARMKALESDGDNLGTRIADSLDAQELKVGGERVNEKISGALQEDSKPTYTQASSRANLQSGVDTVKTILGKVMKWFADLKTVAFSGSYTDLSDKPTIPAAQVQADWNQSDSSAVDFVKNKPVAWDYAWLDARHTVNASEASNHSFSVSVGYLPDELRNSGKRFLVVAQIEIGMQQGLFDTVGDVSGIIAELRTSGVSYGVASSVMTNPSNHIPFSSAVIAFRLATTTPSSQSQFELVLYSNSFRESNEYYIELDLNVVQETL